MTAPEHSSADHESAAPTESAPSKKRRSWLKFPRSWKEVKQLGWKFIVAFILFYLIRDSILYILIPYLVYKGIISF
ncbi:hypothetical protein GF420_07790 [candidate division GN15 bacterium]|jgi:hypothetical protein|nr:hypothetical protein [candidate division GN15 bacterium]